MATKIPKQLKPGFHDQPAKTKFSGEQEPWKISDHLFKDSPIGRTITRLTHGIWTIATTDGNNPDTSLWSRNANDDDFNEGKQLPEA